MKVLSVPHVTQLTGESGINTVVKNYFALAPKYDIEFVEPETHNFDLLAVHAGMSDHYNPKLPLVSHVHGLYWTADYSMPNWAYHANQFVTRSILTADAVTVPSDWVAETFQRDMRFSPTVIPHGIEWDEWQHNKEPGNYVIGYAKNRSGVDVCNPAFLRDFSKKFSGTTFVATFAPPGVENNVKETGVIPRADMKKLVQQANVFISTTKETFGIGILEAMASGVPVLAFNNGGAASLVRHGVTGYLAQPNNYDDLADGLNYCIRHRKVLSENSRIISRSYTWERAMELVAVTYQRALSNRQDPTVGIVIPVYNKSGAEVKRALGSILNQTWNDFIKEVVVVDDGSSNSEEIRNAVLDMAPDVRVQYIRQDNKGVAIARNVGIAECHTKYIICLDGDDELDPLFIEATLPPLEEDKTLGISYTGLMTVMADGKERLSQWPGEFDYNAQLQRKNQVPTCCMFRRLMWERLGGYKQRYAPTGAGAEDAEFFLRGGAYGWRGKQATTAGLFRYHIGSNLVVTNPNYQEVDWTSWHPWTKDKKHPFASAARAERGSHPVRQYDEPAISVVIPVGKGHEELLWDALDSLEAQTLRKWEAIVVLDSNPHNTTGEVKDGMFPEFPWYTKLKTSYPYARLFYTAFAGNEPGVYGRGPGVARNLGVKMSRAPHILFLDADDWYQPQALEKMLHVHLKTGNAVYTDYLGIAQVGDITKLARNLQENVISHGKTMALIKYAASDFDCARALLQPENPPYLWCNINTIIRREWHDRIGGFDETMSSWEDIDYWYRMAWSGVCFTRIGDPDMVYRFSTGNRRDRGGELWDSLIAYITEKKKTLEVVMGCGCENNSSPAPTYNMQAQQLKGNELLMNDNDMVMARYDHPNKGEHGVTGPATGINYGYRGGGDQFLVNVADIRIARNLFVVIEDREAMVQPALQPPPPEPTPIADPTPIPTYVAGVEEEQPKKSKYFTPLPPEPPVEVQPDEKVINRILNTARFDLQLLPGVNERVAKAMKEYGIHSAEQILKLGVPGLERIKFVGEVKAQLIYDYVYRTYGGDRLES